MDGISAAASIISIATAGIQISIKLVTLSTQISSASERVSSIGNDVSLTSGVLHQLGELMTQKTTGHGISIFSRGGLETTRTSAAMCERIFQEVETMFGKASEQLRGCRKFSGGKIKLSKSEKLKWPFLQPSIDILRADLREAKGTLMLMLQVTTLALSKKMADLNASASSEQSDIFRAIIALQQQQGLKSHRDSTEKKRLSTGSIGSIPTKSSETFKPESAPPYWPPILPDAPPSKATHILPVEHPTRHRGGTSHGQREPGVVESADGSSASIATVVSSQAEELMPEDYTSSSATRASSQPFQNRIYAGTPTSTEYGSSIYGGLHEGKRLQDYQPKLLCLEQENARRLIARNANQTEVKPLPIASKSQLSSEENSDLLMFMLKPIVKDYFDKIELSWSVQNPKMHESVIRKHLARMEADGLPSVMDMLENLYDHEHSTIDAHQELGELLSLKRIKTDIQHRDIVFKGVPGLQFVLEPRKASKDSTENLEISSLPPELAFRSKTIREAEIWAGLQGLRLNEHGLIIGLEGRPVAIFVEGDMKAAVNRPLNDELQIVDDIGRVIGTCAPVSEDIENATSQGPFSGLGNCIVASSGHVKDKQGNIVGLVIESNAEGLIGCTVNEYGNILDNFGEIQGRAELYETDEEQTDEVPRIATPPFGEWKGQKSSEMSIDPSAFKEVQVAVGPRKEPFLQETRPRKIEHDMGKASQEKLVDKKHEMEKVFRENVARKESRFLQHEEELRARRRELESLEIQRLKLDQAKLRVETRGRFDAETADFKKSSIWSMNRERPPKINVPLKSKRKALTASIERERVVYIQNKMPMRRLPLECHYSSCSYEGESETDIVQHMKKAHRWIMPTSSRSAESAIVHTISTSPTFQSFQGLYFMGFNGATSDPNDPNQLENFDFDEFLQGDAFDFDTDSFDQNEIEIPEQDHETSNELLPGSQMTKSVPAHFGSNDKTPTRADVSVELRTDALSFEGVGLSEERTAPSFLQRIWLLKDMIRRLEGSVKYIKPVVSPQNIHGNPDKGLQLKFKYLEEDIEESNRMIAAMDDRFRNTDVKASNFEREIQALEIICKTLETRHEAMARKYEDIKKELDILKSKKESGLTLDHADVAPSGEIFKSFRVSMEDPLTKVMPAALKKYGISADAGEYSLYVTYEDKEMCLGVHDKPLIIFKQLDKEGRKPQFMLRRGRPPQVQEIKTTSSAEKTSEPQVRDRTDNPTIAGREGEEAGNKTAVPQEEQDASLLHETQSAVYAKSYPANRARLDPYQSPIQFNRTSSNNTDYTSGDVPGRIISENSEDAELYDLSDEELVPQYAPASASEELRKDKASETTTGRFDDVDAEVDSAEEEFGEEEYSDDDDDDRGMKEKNDVEGRDAEAEKEIVDGLLREYTTLYPFSMPATGIQLPAGLL